MIPSEEIDRVYSIQEVISRSGLCRAKIYSEINSGRLAAKKLGSRTLIKATAFADWIDGLPDYPSPSPSN